MESYLSTDEQLFMIRLSWILCSCNVRFSSLNIVLAENTTFHSFRGHVTTLVFCIKLVDRRETVCFVYSVYLIQ